MFSKTTTLNLMKKFGSKYHQEQLLELTFYHLTLVFSWMKRKPVFLKHSNCSHSFGSDILMTYFWYGHMSKNDLIYFSKILTRFIQTWNLRTKHLRIVLIFLDLNVSLKGGTIFTDLHIKHTDGHQVRHHKSSDPSHIKNSLLHSARLWELADSVHHRMISMHIFLIWRIGFWREITLRK